MTYVVTEACIKCKYMDCVEDCPVNRTYSAQWPNITRKGEVPDDADRYRDEKDKFKRYFHGNSSLRNEAGKTEPT